MRVVFPELRERLEKHRVHLVDIDLRWGVTKEQADNDQALDLCLQEIDECRPSFIEELCRRFADVRLHVSVNEHGHQNADRPPSELPPDSPQGSDCTAPSPVPHVLAE